MDPSSAAARAVDELTDVALPHLPMTDVDRVEGELLGELATIEKLARLVWEGTERCDFCRGRECVWCVGAKAVLESLGFGPQMREWAAL
jgi:hypothetical protein